MDTIRDRLSRKRRRLYLLMLLGLPCFIGGMIASEYIYQWFVVLALAGFVYMFIFIMLILLGVRCPKCNGNVGYAISYPTTWNMSVSKEIKFCPFCGVSLDTEMKDINQK